MNCDPTCIRWKSAHEHAGNELQFPFSSCPFAFLGDEASKHNLWLPDIKLFGGCKTWLPHLDSFEFRVVSSWYAHENFWVRRMITRRSNAFVDGIRLRLIIEQSETARRREGPPRQSEYLSSGIRLNGFFARIRKPKKARKPERDT